MFLAGQIPGGGPRGHAATSIFTPWVLAAFCGLDLLILGLAVWGILTAIGLHRLRNWARSSVLVIGGGLAVIGLFYVLCTLMMIFIPPPMLPDMDARQTQMMQPAFKIGIVFGTLIYGAMLAIGVWWLAYFNRRNVRALFTEANGNAKENRRPLLIAVIAVLLVIGTLFCYLMAFVPLPGLIFALIPRGWEKVLLLSVYAAFGVAAAIGLWRLKEWGRRLTLALITFGVINCFIYLVRPSLLLVGLAGDVSKSMTLADSAFWQYFLFMMRVEMVLPLILLIAIAIILQHYRDRFRELIELLPTETGAST
jgi:hypothetical protein